MARILTTHTGSLPRPDELIAAMWAKGDGVPVDEEALAQLVARAVDETVRKQVEAGVDVINDGEMSKPSYATYVKDRLGGFGGKSPENYYFADLADYPKSMELVAANPGRRKRTAPACTGPITVKDAQAAADDMLNLQRAARADTDTGQAQRARFAVHFDRAVRRPRWQWKGRRGSRRLGTP